MDMLGQIGLIPGGTGFFARGIEIVTRSDVFHVVICIDETHVISAVPGGARIDLITDWPNAVWSRFPLTHAQAQGCADYAREREGRPYNYAADAVIGFECITHIRFPEFVNDWLSRDKSLECAQFADAALTIGGGYQVFDDGRDFGVVYPGSFERLFKKYGWWPLGLH